MKRDKRLVPLSWNHQTGLAFVYRLNKELEERSPEPIHLRDSVGVFWVNDLAPHFRAEEDILLPAVRASGSSCDAELERMLEEHRALRELRDRLLAETDADALRDFLASFARLLHDHIRFEERELFPKVESAIPSERFDRVGVALEEALSHGSCATSLRNMEK